MANLDILSWRYATDAINNLFSERGKIVGERKLWIAVMKAQKELGVDIPARAIEKYEGAVDNVNLDRINEIEAKTRHDVKAKIQAFNEAAGVEKLSETIELPPDIAGMGVQTVGPSQPVTTTQTTSLPLTDDQIVQGLHVKIALSLRWLAQWCIRQLKVVHIHLKKAHGKIVRVSK